MEGRGSLDMSSNGQGPTMKKGLAMKIEADVYNTWEVENR